MRIAKNFDNFVSECPYFNGNADVNNGYGCEHKAQKEVRNDMNHASAGFTHNLDSISVVLRHYIKWIEEIGKSINPKEK